jgi:NAD dependent epimerase/dehydratase family enzyme
MLEQLARLTRLGLAAQVGSGHQFWPWVSLRDEVRAWEFALAHQTLSGPVNLAGPQLAEAGQVTASLARLEHRPYWLTIPTFAVQAAGLAARELLLGSQPVKPAALESHGFDFQDRTVESAL